MEAKDDLRIDAAVEAIVHGVYDSGALYDPHRWWPRSYLPYSPLFAADFHGRWVEQWRRIPRAAPRPYARATALWVLLAMASRSLKALFDVQERCEIVLALLDDIQAAKAGDVFCRDGSHHVLTSLAAQQSVDQLTFESADDRSVDRAYSVLNASLLAYSEAIFFSANCTVRDVHGPYDVLYCGDRCQLIVRDYYRLRDARLEPETAGLKYDALCAYSLYDGTIGFSFSVLNDYTSDRPLTSSVVAHAATMTVDGQDRPLNGCDEVRQVNELLGATIATVSARVRTAASLDQTLEIIRRTYYRASPIASAVGEDWAPTEAFMSDFVANLREFEGAMPPPMTREEFGAMVDPRV